jgi:hypothetical protein
MRTGLPACIASATLSAALLLSACGGHVVDTFPIGPGDIAPCNTALGSYFLPKGLLNLTVTANYGTTPPVITVTTPTAPASAITTVADRSQAFCLDYLSSPVSQDVVTVSRDANGLLQSINSNVEDRTPAIATALIQTAENLAIASARSTALPIDKLDLTFDPFDWHDLILAKKALRRFALCLYVEGYSFPAEGLSTAQIYAAAHRWCSTDRPVQFEHPLYQFARSPVPPELMREGVLYRPNATYNIVILAKEDPGSRASAWLLYQTKRVEMPNASPVLSIGIDRAMFAKRITTVNFSNGTLTDVAVDKGSEAVGFVQIPLVAVQAIVAVPTQIIKIRLADTQSHAALIQAQGNLLNAVASYNAMVAKGNTTGSTPGGKSADVSSGEFVGACVNAGGNPDTCAKLQQGSQ